MILRTSVQIFQSITPAKLYYFIVSKAIRSTFNFQNCTYWYYKRKSYGLHNVNIANIGNSLVERYVPVWRQLNTSGKSSAISSNSVYVVSISNLGSVFCCVLIRGMLFPKHITPTLQNTALLNKCWFLRVVTYVDFVAVSS